MAAAKKARITPTTASRRECRRIHKGLIDLLATYLEVLGRGRIWLPARRPFCPPAGQLSSPSVPAVRPAAPSSGCCLCLLPGARLPLSRAQTAGGAVRRSEADRERSEFGCGSTAEGVGIRLS